MRKNLLFLALLLVFALPRTLLAQITCSAAGNLFVYTNYDGGVLNIDVNVNIPNIKIGVCTYEPTTINITGAFVGNVTEVRYAGYVSTNNHHCSNSPSTTTITGVPSNITSVNFLPPSTLANPNGYGNIVCAYSCSTTSNQGGCNTADQIKDYFQTSMGATLRSYFTQYGCFSTSPYQLSVGGNCCTAIQCNMTANAGADQAMCPGGQVTLTGSATGGATTYTWSPSTGLSNPNAASTTASPAVTTTYILTATDGGVCSDQDTVTVTVHQPQASVGPFNDVCIDIAPFALGSGNPGGGTYSGPGVINGSFDPLVAGAGTHVISYAVVDGNGCSANATASIVVHDLPTVTLAPIGPFCQNDPAQILQNGAPAGGTYAGNGVLNGVFDPGTAGAGSATISYQYTDGFGCSDMATQTVTVVANPAAPVLQFTNPNVITTSSGDSIQWFFNGSYLLTNGSTIAATQDGNYTAVVWVNGCASDTSAPLSVVIDGLADGWGNVAVQAWPNPAGNEIHVAIQGLEFQATLLDMLGREVRPSQSISSEGMISVQGLSKGVYTLRIHSEFGDTALRILKD